MPNHFAYCPFPKGAIKARKTVSDRWEKFRVEASKDTFTLAEVELYPRVIALLDKLDRIPEGEGVSFISDLIVQVTSSWVYVNFWEKQLAQKLYHISTHQVMFNRFMSEDWAVAEIAFHTQSKIFLLPLEESNIVTNQAMEAVSDFVGDPMKMMTWPSLTKKRFDKFFKPIEFYTFQSDYLKSSLTRLSSVLNSRIYIRADILNAFPDLARICLEKELLDLFSFSVAQKHPELGLWPGIGDAFLEDTYPLADRQLMMTPQLWSQKQGI